MGKLTATGRVELCPTAEFDGDITTSSLIVREGAKFNGRATMEHTAAAGKNPRIVASNGKPISGKDGPNIDKVESVAHFTSPDVNVTNS